MRNSIKLTALTLITLLFGSLTAIPARSDIEPQISADANGTCALDPQGLVHCWGLNDHGQTDVPLDLGEAVQVSMGYYSACAVTITRAVKCWGDNSFKQSNVPANLEPAEQVAVGALQACALLVVGTVRCWGDNSVGEISVPVGLDSVTQITSGAAHVCALNKNGVVRCWGFDAYAETDIPSTLGFVVQISARGDFTCALDSIGKSLCWGFYAYGARDVPTNLGRALSVSAGESVACALLENKSVRCWGEVSPGALKIPDDLGPVAQLTVGANHVCALTHAGILRCWGGYSPAVGTVPTDLNLQRIIQVPQEPQITGEGAVGATLTASIGIWDSNVDIKYQWLRDGNPLAEATTPQYKVDVNDFLHNISLQISASRSGYRSVTLSSAATKVTNWPLSLYVHTQLCPMASLDVSSLDSSQIQPIALSGAAQVGQMIRGSSGIWPIGTKLCRIWVENSKVVNNLSSGANYHTTSSDIGQTLQFIVVGTDKNGLSRFRISQPVVIGKQIFAKAGAPVITGNTFANGFIRAKVMAWSSSVQYSYQWFRNGIAIASATSTKYRITAADSKSLLSVQVCGHKDNYEDLCLTSDSRTVG